jgi:SET domain
MPKLLPPQPKLEHLVVNRFPSDRLAIASDGGLIHGNSLVAKKPFKRGEVIMPVIGTLSAPSYITIQIDVGRHLGGDVIAFLNHSCRPTAVVQAPALDVRAAVDLKEGDEITFFYPSTEWDMVRPFKCLCGARNCIGFVAGAQYLSIDILKRYFINPHIQKLAAGAFRRVGPEDASTMLALP